MQKIRRVLQSGKPASTFYYLLKGKQPGPVCMITAGIHGKEIAGILAAQRLQQLDIKRGTLILVPVVNLQAYDKRIRGIPDLNRTFPRRPGDAPRHQLAKQLMQLAACQQPGWCLDLHEATGFSKLNRLKLGQTLICYPNRSALNVSKRVLLRINRSINLPYRQFTVRSTVLPGSFRTAAARLLASNSVTVETSMNLPLAVRIQYQYEIAIAFLTEIGLL